MATKSSDNLVDILRQIQARKTIRPEDANRALQQYRKVQENIKELKSEIELFKSTQMERDKQEAQQKSQQKENPAILTKKGSVVRSSNDALKQVNPPAKVIPKPVNSVPQLNGVPTKGTKLLRKPSVSSIQDSKMTADSKTIKPVNVPQLNGVPTKGAKLPRKPSIASIQDSKITADSKTIKPVKQQTKPEDKPNGSDSSTDKDKELARLRLQNAGMRVIAENKAAKSTGPSSIQGSEVTTSRSEISEFKGIPNAEKLAVEFKKIHEVEYRTAFHDLDKHCKMKEDKITELLAGIAKEAYTFCQNTSRQQFEDILKAHAHVMDVLIQPKYSSSVTKDVVSSKTKSVLDKQEQQLTRRFLKDYRRAMARVPISGFTEIFERIIQRDVLGRYSNLRTIPKPTKGYVHRLLEINWFMSIHDPPMAQVWPRGGQLMNRDWFTPYGKKGATILHTVWPALFYHKDGTMAERGVCLVK